MSKIRLSTPGASLMERVVPQSVTLTRARHDRLMKAMPVFNFLTRWLATQPNVVREGHKPVYILRQVLEQAAKMVDPKSSADDERNAYDAIYALLTDFDVE